MFDRAPKMSLTLTFKSLSNIFWNSSKLCEPPDKTLLFLYIKTEEEWVSFNPVKREWNTEKRLIPPKGWQVETYWCWKYFWIKYFAFNPWLSFSFFLYHFFLATQLKLTIETLEQGMKYVQSWQSRHKVDVIGVVLVSL